MTGDDEVTGAKREAEHGRPRRRYTSSRRSAQAAQTRDDVVTAAAASFAESGWAGTTMAAIAVRAGVSTETVYGAFGSKKRLLMTALDVAVVGDTEPVPFVEREAFRRMGEGQLEERWRVGLEELARINARTGGIWRAFLEAAATDPDVARLRDEKEAARRADVKRSAERIVGYELDDATVDTLWALFGSELYDKLVGQSGWNPTQYVDMLTRVTRALVDDAPAARR